MAIERLVRLQFVVQKSELKNFRNELFRQSLIHLRNISQKLDPLASSPVEEQALKAQLIKIRYLLDTAQKYSSQKSAFIDNFIPNKPMVDWEMVGQLQEEKFLHELFDKIKRNDDTLTRCQDRLDLIENEMCHLRPYENYVFQFETLAYSKNVAVWMIETRQRSREDMKRLFPLLFELALVEEAPVNGDQNSAFIIFAPCTAFEQISAYIKRTDLQVLNIHNYSGTPSEMMHQLEQEKTRLITCIKASKKSMTQLNAELPQLYCLSDIIESQLLQLGGEKKFTSSRQVVVIEGYIRGIDYEKVQKWLTESFPKVFLRVLPADEEAPIKFRNQAFFAPFEFLLRMFGLPRYGMIDPTPVVAILFLVLFGIAFGDVLYGLSLVLICTAVARKYSHDPGTVKFMNMFKYAGISSAVVGVITTSWAGDLVSTYVPSTHWLHRIHRALGLINTGEHVMVLMVAIIYLGVLAQMLAVSMAMFQHIKEKKWTQAILDQFSWILFMPAVTLVIGQFLVPGHFPGTWVLWAGRVVLLAVGMIFIGGFIKVKNPIGGIFSGVLNFYGIMSTYGVSALMSDVLSYLRLLALAVATSSMAMSFNLVSFMFRDIPVIGFVLVTLVLIFSNVLNLLLSVLGAFVHPVRLLFYELFSRFYQDGGHEFVTYGLRFRNVFVKQREA